MHVIWTAMSEMKVLKDSIFFSPSQHFVHLLIITFLNTSATGLSTEKTL